MTYTHLTNEQRTQIEALDKEGMSRIAIGRRLGRHATTIGRELGRLGAGVVYEAEQAQLEAQCLRQVARRPSKWTPRLVAEVEAGMADGWSPHQIAGRWRRAGRAQKTTVSGETIYLRVAADRRAGGESYRLLRRGGRKRRSDRCGTRRGHRLRVRPEQELSQRPKVINERGRVGDWEVDLIIGAGQRGAVLVAVERQTRFCRLRLLANKAAPGVASALLNALKGMPVSSLTKDRGLEWAGHERVARRLEAKIYFCRPYHSWEKGSVENHNGLLREYWPKDLALDTLTPQSVSRVEASLNARPRRVLGFATPAEVMLEVG